LCIFLTAKASLEIEGKCDRRKGAARFASHGLLQRVVSSVNAALGRYIFKI